MSGRKPVFVNLAVTGRCNCRCRMCAIWEHAPAREATLAEYEVLFSSSSLRRVSRLSLTGGEPTLRADLGGIVEAALRRFPLLAGVSLNSNGFSETLVERAVREIARHTGGKGVPLAIGLSLDGVGEVHDRVRGVEGAFARMRGTLDRLKALEKEGVRFHLSLRCTVSRENLGGLEEVRRFAGELGLPITFGLANAPEVFIASAGKADRYQLSPEETDRFLSFLDRACPADPVLGFLRSFSATGVRERGCIGREGKALLFLPDGDILPCGEFEGNLIGNFLQEPFDRIWAGKRADEVYAGLGESCRRCPTLCYPEAWTMADFLKVRAKRIRRLFLSRRGRNEEAR